MACCCCRFQIDAGAHAIQIFDSWGGQLTPDDWDVFSKPYIQMVSERERERVAFAPLAVRRFGLRSGFRFGRRS